MHQIPADPTPMMNGIFPAGKDTERPESPQQKSPKPDKGQPGGAPAQGGPQPAGGGLPGLMARIRTITDRLRAKVRGQDHAVRAFAEGWFNAEILDRADEKRRRPKAVFLFAGPPGMGKTYLAEQAAEAVELPFKRFDMSTYSTDMAVEQLSGFRKSYRSASPGDLSGYVEKNPRSFLLFDEIEKVHPTALLLFLQILDAGKMWDQYHERDVSFRDTIIVFTTNAGRNLYEADPEADFSALSARTIINALQTDVNPVNGKPFFPAAICSRLASGTVLMFNYLKSHDLETICRGELERSGELFFRQHGIRVTVDDKVPSLLMYREGGIVDARSLRAQTELFFKNELMKCLELYRSDNIRALPAGVKTVHFAAEEWETLAALHPMFRKEAQPEVLLFGNNGLGHTLQKRLPGYRWSMSERPEEALAVLAEKDVQLVLIDPAPSEVWADHRENTSMHFDHIPEGASVLRNVRAFLRLMKERLPHVPVWLLERAHFPIDEQLELALIRSGVRGKLDVRSSSAGEYQRVLDRTLAQIHLQAIAGEMKAKRQILSFETAPQEVRNQQTLVVRCRNYRLRQAVDADDAAVVDQAERPDVRFADVIGAESAKEELKFFAEFLMHPKKYIAKGMKMPKGVLLYGPPGTGKTLLAKAMAGECGIAFLSATASNFVGQYTGTGPAAVRKLFEQARRYAPAIVFIDEIDAIGRTRTGGTGAHAEEVTLNTLLTEMDGFRADPRRPVFILAATNFKVQEGVGGPGYIDPALVRRFDRKICVDLPDRKERVRLLKMLCGKQKNCTVSDKMLELIAGRSLGMSPAILTNVVNHAARMAQRTGKPMDDAMLEEAFETSVHGEAKEWGCGTLTRVAWHEAGHAYMYWKNGHVPAYVTIVARGSHGGYMQHEESEAAAPLKTRDELLANIRVALAGRAAEVLYYGTVQGLSTGVSGDLKSATDTARRLLCEYGMDDELGLICIGEKDLQCGELAMQVHRRTAALLREAFRETLDLLTAERPRLERLVQALLEKNRLTGDEICALLEDPAYT